MKRNMTQFSMRDPGRFLSAWPWSGVTRATLVALAWLTVAGSASAQLTLVLSNKWSVAPGTRYYLPTSGNYPRGMGLNRTTGNVLVPSIQGGSNHLEVVSGVDGSDLGSLATGGAGNGILTGGDASPPFQVGVAEDGAVYACNLATGGTGNFKLFRWAGEDLAQTNLPVVAFGPAAPGATITRIGDSFGIRGAGTNTQIIASGTGSTNFTVFTTADGTNFVPNQFGIPTAAGGAGAFRRTVAFNGTNNAFYGGTENSSVLRYCTFDLGTLTCTFVSNVTVSAAIGMCSVAGTNGFNILAGIQDAGGSTHQLVVYDLNYKDSPAIGGNVAFPSGGAVDGNITGGTAIGNGMVVGFNTHNGLVALSTYFLPAVAPTITASPAGGTVFPPWSLTVSAAGSAPLRYQWQASRTNAPGTFTNIPGATANSYAVTIPSTNYFQVVVTNVAGSVTSTPVLLTALTAVTNSVVTQNWRVAAGASGYTYLNASDNATRGIGYDTNSGRVVVAGTSGGNGIYVLNATNGANLWKLDLTGMLTSGTLALDQVGVADDGAVYAGNLALTPGDSFHLTRWPAPTTNAAAATAYDDSIYGSLSTGDRWGDTLAVRGAGANTQILLGSRGGTNVALLTSADGVSFTAVVIAITNVPKGFAGNGIAFGEGNTLWGKVNLGHLYKVAFDPVALTGGLLFDYANPGQTPTYMVGLGVDPVRNILAGVDLNPGYKPNDLKLFQLTGTPDAPVLFHQALFASANGNGNANAAIAMKFPRVFALDVNNGLVALTYGVPPASPPTIPVPPANQTVYTNDPAVTFSVQVSGSLPLYYQWRFNSNNIPNATNSSYVLSYPPLSAAGYYDVVVRNIAGMATSAPPALLTVITPVQSLVVTQLWTLAGGSRSYLDASSYETRGLAYDTNTESVLVADHYNIYALSATNGSDLFQLNTIGMPTSGYNGWTVDQVGVAEDGAVYSCNLTLSGPGFSIISWPSVGAGVYPNYAYGGTSGADPSGTGDRWGDTLTARGAGPNTELLCGSFSGTRAVLFTNDGSGFVATVINVTNAPAGFSGQGIAFGPGNTFWAKTPGYNLRLVSYDVGSGTGQVIQTYTAGTQINSTLGGIGVDVDRQILGGVVFADIPNTLSLYLLSGNANPPALFEQAFFGSKNLNSQENSVTTLKGGKAFALDVNNGLVALSYGTPPLPPFPITSVSYQTGTGATLTWVSFSNRTYQVTVKNALSDPTWTPVGPTIPAAGATTSYTDVTATGATRYYRVQGQ